MPLKAKHCTQCGAPLVTQVVEDRLREVCPDCAAIAYRNPLPVAAAVVLNEEREVLLVRRKNEPYKDMWCLPIGFAELGETIAQAAQRELTEETGIEGRVLRLLDADSYASEFYGDLLIVTFEMQKVDGTERAGDDAREVAYYPIHQAPPLAFSSNEKALRTCIGAHEEEWAIRDSFRNLHLDETRELLSDALVALVRDHADEVTGAWQQDVRSNATTRTYATIDAGQLYERGYTAISQFGRWLRGSEADVEVEAFYLALGRERRQQGFALHEVLSSLTLLRKHVWLFSRTEGVWQSPMDVYRVMELNRRIAVFFDKALYHTARGFEGT